MNNLTALAWAGCCHTFDYPNNCDLFADADGVVWSHRMGPVSDIWTPRAPYGMTPIELKDGTPVGYTNIKPKDKYPVRLLENPKPLEALLGVPPHVATFKYATLETRISYPSAGYIFIADKIEDLENLRDVKLFHRPPALRLNLDYGGGKVWFHLDEQIFLVEIEAGTPYYRSIELSLTQIENLLAGANHGQRRGTSTPRNRNPAGSAGTSAQPGTFTASRTVRLPIATGQNSGSGVVINVGAGSAWFTLSGDRYEPKPKKPLPRAVQTGEIIAWRGFAIAGGPIKTTGSTISLTSIYKTQHVWKPATTFESAAPNDHNHDDGIHAFKTREAATAYLTQHYASSTIVLGTVRLWGEVIDCTLGYRAQFAAIASLEEVLNNHGKKDSIHPAQYIYNNGAVTLGEITIYKGTDPLDANKLLTELRETYLLSPPAPLK